MRIRTVLAGIAFLTLAVKSLNLPANFVADWVDHGYPFEEGSAAA